MKVGFGNILEEKDILICVGSGGVGKTTTAATLAIEAARRGMRVLVLTIDPAKRLANALGLEGLGHDIQRVPSKMLHDDDSSKGELYAMMLDQKRAFDQMVERHATDPAAVKRILDNPVYKQVSGTLAGAQEYAAMIVVHEFDREKNFDLIVVDTPPTSNALDFLDAPEKLTHFLDSPAIEWFRKIRGQEDPTSGGWSAVGRTGSYVLKKLSKFVGTQFLQDLAVFFTEFNDVVGGFKRRAEETYTLLRQDKVGFILITSPEPMALQEAMQFHERLISSSMPFAGAVINKVHRDLPLEKNSDDQKKALFEEIKGMPSVREEGKSDHVIESAIENMLKAHKELQTLAEIDKAAIKKLQTQVGADVPVVTVPFFDADIHHIDRLKALGKFVAN